MTETIIKTSLFSNVYNAEVNNRLNSLDGNSIQKSMKCACIIF